MRAEGAAAGFRAGTGYPAREAPEAMGLFDLFRRRPRIGDVEATVAFVRSRASFLVQKCVWEYARARAGTNWEKLFHEAEFKAAIDLATWSNLPLALAYLMEMIEGEARARVAGERARLTEGVVIVAEQAVVGFAPPDSAAQAFAGEAAAIGPRLRRVALAAVKPVRDIPLASHGEFMGRLPIHASLRALDAELVRNNLRLFLCSIHAEWVKTADLDAVAAALVDLGRREAADR